jgi:hypothetical protein
MPMTTSKSAAPSHSSTAKVAASSGRSARARKRHGDKPKVYERLAAELPINAAVTEALVDDPLEPGARLKVLRSVRDDPLAGLLARGTIGEDLFAAGRCWQRHHEAATIGSVTAMDPTKPAVDGGARPDPITDRQIRAIRALAAADAVLGARDQSLIRDILGARMSLADAARRRNWPGERGSNYAGRRFRDALDTLAALWGFRTTGG